LLWFAAAPCLVLSASALSGQPYYRTWWPIDLSHISVTLAGAV